MEPKKQLRMKPANEILHGSNLVRIELTCCPHPAVDSSFLLHLAVRSTTASATISIPDPMDAAPEKPSPTTNLTVPGSNPSYLGPIWCLAAAARTTARSTAAAPRTPASTA
jgi:hypothetical protein